MNPRLPLSALLAAYLSLAAIIPLSGQPAKFDASIPRINELITLGKKQQWIDPYLTLDYADQALTIAQSTDYEEGVAAAKNLQGFCYWSFGDNELAIKAALEALEIADNRRLRAIQAESYYILARAYMDVAESPKAMESIRKAEALAGEGNDWELLSSIYNLRGVILFIDDKVDSALLLYNRAYKLGQDRRIDPINFPRILSNIGECYEDTDRARAMDYFNSAVNLADETGNQIAKASITGAIGHALLRQNDLRGAEANLQSALQLAQKLGLRRVIRHAYAGLVDIRLRQNKGEEAIVYLQRYYAVRDSLLNPSKIRQIVELEANYALKLKEQNIELLEQERRFQRLLNNTLIALVGLLIILSIGGYQLQQYRYRRNREMLNLEIDYLTQQQKMTEDRYKAALSPEADDLIESQDQKLLKRAIAVVDTFLTDPLFGVEKMAAELNMSRTNLHRKLKAITGFPPSELIRSIRLKKAARMILNQADTVTQISLLVGFDDYSHFSKSFKKYYGVAPTLYAEHNRREMQGDVSG
jgi:AraC-like DNA-binding protein